MTNHNKLQKIPFSEYLQSFKKTLKSVFYERDNIESFIQKRGFPALVLRDIMAHNPLSVSIPEEYGGRGVNVKEITGIIEAASYESLPLALTFGINIGLFLEPVTKYAQAEVKTNIFKRFLTQQNMGGLMITEPDHGSDALRMETYHVKQGNNYHVKGVKHWQGLTGIADYWLITSREQNTKGQLNRDIDFFIADVQQKNQSIEVEELFNNIGLYPIPYGKNIINIQVPSQFKLIPETTGIKLMLDLLHRSRMQFPAMGIGFINRMLDEAISHCNHRVVGGKSLMNLDQVKYQIAKIQSAYTIASAMCFRSANYSGIENNLSGDVVEACCTKAHISDLMQESSQILTQLKGANGYKTESVGARGIVDSRPFQVFEGSNEMLYTQAAEVVLKKMTKQKKNNLFEFASNYNLTNNAASYFKSILAITISDKTPQRKLVDLGKIISKLIASNQIITLGEKGFNADLIEASLAIIKHEVADLINSYKSHSNVIPIEDYKINNSWLQLS